ncbi:MAG: hypothetical protein ABW250_04490 [Pyrinomonadaceae bacterium]
MGDYSKDPNTVLQDARAKGYSRVLFQQGKPMLDRDLNLLADLNSPRLLAKHYVGRGPLPVEVDWNQNDGFKITGLNFANHDFVIKAGSIVVDGLEVVLAQDTTYKTQPHRENVKPLPSGYSVVYLRVFTSEVNEAADPALQNNEDLGFATSLRERVEWEVKVVPYGEAFPPVDPYYLLATMTPSANSVSDQRVPLQTTEQIVRELKLAAGNQPTMSYRLSQVLQPDGKLAEDVAGITQLRGQWAYDNNVTLGANAVTDVTVFNVADPRKEYTFFITKINTSGSVAWQEVFTGGYRCIRLTNLANTATTVHLKIFGLIE